MCVFEHSEGMMCERDHQGLVVGYTYTVDEIQLNLI